MNERAPTNKQQNLVRMSFNLPEEVHEELVNTLPWGVQGHFISALVRIALKRIRQAATVHDGHTIIGAIIKGDYDPLQG